VALRRAGFEALSATTPDQALYLARHHPAPIDLILSDIVMPGMNGPALVEAILPLRPAIRIVFMTGYARADDLPNLEQPGAPLIQKPFGPLDLVSRIDRVLLNH
jgi:CheY-like chemotaxis protein